ncbi:sortase [Nocardioidaceae bacterium]|nr:sortase [Nocardioidaceae bacterium]
MSDTLRAHGNLARTSVVVAVATLGWVLSACGAPGARDGLAEPAYAGLVEPLAAPGAVVDRPAPGEAGPGLPGPLAARTWDRALRVGAPGGDPGALTVAPASPESDPAPGTARTGTPDRSAERTRPGSAISLPTGVGEDDYGTVAAPVRVEIPRVGIESDLDDLGLQGDGELEAPPRWGTAGWFAGGPRPGERGPAVIAGHLDSPFGAAVFASLPLLVPGDTVRVTDALGRAHVFEVTRVARTPKQGFPTREVYGAVPGAELRLITCTGAYVPGAGGYQDNLLVFARLVR